MKYPCVGSFQHNLSYMYRMCEASCGTPSKLAFLVLFKNFFWSDFGDSTLNYSTASSFDFPINSFLTVTEIQTSGRHVYCFASDSMANLQL
jgi:hypothetical protein